MQAVTAYVQAIQASAPSFGVQLTLVGVSDAAEVERAIDTRLDPKERKPGELPIQPSENSNSSLV